MWRTILLGVGLLLVGALENFLYSINTDFRVRKSKLGVFFTSLIIGISWCYIVGTVSDNLTRFELILSYSIGFGLGDMLGIHFNSYVEKLVRKYDLKIKRFKRRKMLRKK
jgi:uncharacterized protein YebE (UPF0316 family)